MVKVLSSDEFSGAVLDSKEKILVDFSAVWCGPCNMLAPVLEEIEKEYPAANIVKVDIDKSPDLAQKYGVSAVPTLILFEEGKPAGQVVGYQQKENVVSMLGL